MLNVHAMAVGSYDVNAVLVWCDRTRDAVLFDAAAEADYLIAEIDRRALALKTLVCTHGHLDHIAENAALKEHYGVPLLIHPLDRPMLTDPAKNLSLFTGQPVISPDADGTLEDGDELPVGAERLRALHVPGHTAGSLVFHHPGFLISGDTLFAGGIGRTDFPGGSEPQLLRHIREKILTLPDETVVYPGHGPATTVGTERRTNPFLRG